MLLPTRVVDDNGTPTKNWVIVETTTGQTDFKQYENQWDVEKTILESPAWLLRQLGKEMMIG